MHRSVAAVVTLLASAALALSIGPASPSPAAAQAAMVATGVSPNYGPSSGGTLVTITGTGFGSDTGFALLVGSTNAYAYTDVSCTSSTTCTARTPAAPIVQRGDAQQAQTVGYSQTTPPASNPFTVYGPTSLEALLPAYGPATGGTRVTLFGGIFPDGSTFPGPVPQVFFGTTAATDVSCSASGDGNFCEVTAPARNGPLPVTVPVTIVSVGGTSPEVAFTYYPPPQATLISPNYAPSTGGMAVTITGENFAPNQQFQAMINGFQPGPMFTNVNCTSPATCTATTPAIPMGPGATQPIGVIAIGQVLPGEISIQYYGVPVLQSINPSSGAAGTTVTLKGRVFPNNPPAGLPGPISVRFGGAAATNVHCTDDYTCTATVPPGNGTATVTVTTPGGVSNGLPFAYATSSGIPPLPGLPSLPNLPALPALPALPSFPDIPSLPGSTSPTVTSVAPNSGPYTGGTAVTITGANFPSNQAQLGFSFNSGEQFTDVNCTSSTTCTARTPAVPEPPVGWGILNVQATQQNSVAGPGFTVYTAPQLRAISPTSGPATGGTVVTLTGGAFPNGTSYLLGPPPEVSFGGRPATNVRCAARDGTSCTAVAPSGSGTVQVTVTTPGGTSGSLPYTYSASPGLPGLPGPPSLPLPVPSIPTIPQVPVPVLPPMQNP